MTITEIKATARLANFLSKNQLTHSSIDGVAVSVAGGHSYSHNGQYYVYISLNAHGDFGAVVAFFATKEEALTWLENGRKSSRIVNATAKALISNRDDAMSVQFDVVEALESNGFDIEELSPEIQSAIDTTMEIHTCGFNGPYLEEQAVVASVIRPLYEFLYSINVISYTNEVGHTHINPIAIENGYNSNHP